MGHRPNRDEDRIIYLFPVPGRHWDYLELPKLVSGNAELILLAASNLDCGGLKQ